MEKKLHILQHSLGLDEFGQGQQYRNHFVTGEGSKDFAACKEMVADGFMTERADPFGGGDIVFNVTTKGIDYVKINSPTHPKLTRGQKRYQDWLNEDGNMKFGEWLRLERQRRTY